MKTLFLFALLMLGAAPLCAQNAPVPAQITGENAKIELLNLTKNADGSFSGVGEGPRVLRLRVQNPLLQNGQTPVADLEFSIRQNYDTRVQVFADTARGRQLVHSEWGLRPNWRKVKIALDDAFFGARLEGDFDLEIEAAARDFSLKDLQITPFDADQNPDWSRFLKLEKREIGREVAFYARGETANFRFEWRNLARRDFGGKWSAKLSDWNGQTLEEFSGDLRIGAEKQTVLPLQIETEKLPMGAFKIALQIQNESGQTVSQNLFSLGVGSKTEISKAKNGEFLYGLDAALSAAHANPRLMRWMEIMGVDMIRHGFNWNRDLDATARGLAVYEKAGITPLYMMNPSAGEEWKTLAPRLDADAKFAGEFARRFPSIRFYELGNEPDLFGFYRGPIEFYATGMTRMAREIKLANPRAFVTNGGLSFAGDEGIQRSRRFVEVADITHLDALAYHGHGALAKAERAAFERMRATSLEFGKNALPLVETESGVSSRSDVQDEIQARTATQKLVYAQTQKMPFFIWFRLLIFEEPYGNLLSETDPKPVVLAYRHTVERLRGKTFSRSLSTHENGVEAALFAQNDAPSKATIVFWNEREGTREIEISLPGATGARLYDLYGNSQVLRPKRAGVWALEATQSPQFLNFSGEVKAAQLAPPLLQTRENIGLLENRANRVFASVSNPFAREMRAQIALAPRFESAKAAPQTQNLSLKPRETREIVFDLTPQWEANRARLPEIWTVFTGVSDDADFAAWSQNGAIAGEVKSAKVAPKNGTLDLESVAGFKRERAVAWLEAEIESPRTQTLPVTAAADWWMAWRVNGEPVFDTLARGNGGSVALGVHRFGLPLKAGRNRVTVQVLSGSHGWKFLADEARQTPDSLRLELRENGEVLSAQNVAISWRQILKSNGEGAPLAQLGAESVENEWTKTPQSQNWPRGDADLSAKIWAWAEKDRLQMRVEVRDDVDNPAPTNPDSFTGDSVQIAFSRDGKTFEGWILGRNWTRGASAAQIGGGQNAAQTPQNLSVTRDEAAKTTTYRFALDAARLGLQNRDFWLNLQVTDNDGGLYAKQRLSWHGLLNLDSKTAKPAREPLGWERLALPVSDARKP